MGDRLGVGGGSGWWGQEHSADLRALGLDLLRWRGEPLVVEVAEVLEAQCPELKGEAREEVRVHIELLEVHHVFDGRRELPQVVVVEAETFDANQVVELDGDRDERIVANVNHFELVQCRDGIHLANQPTTMEVNSWGCGEPRGGG